MEAHTAPSQTMPVAPFNVGQQQQQWYFQSKPAPTIPSSVFQCLICRSVLSDSYAHVAQREDANMLIVNAVVPHNIVIYEDAVNVCADGPFKGSYRLGQTLSQTRTKRYHSETINQQKHETELNERETKRQHFDVNVGHLNYVHAETLQNEQYPSTPVLSQNLHSANGIVSRNISQEYSTLPRDQLTQSSHEHQMRIPTPYQTHAIMQLSPEMNIGNVMQNVIVDPEPSGEDSPQMNGRSQNEVRLYKCPRAYCSKVYKNPGGLKYHLQSGTCELDSDAAPVVIAPGSSSPPPDGAEPTEASLPVQNEQDGENGQESSHESSGNELGPGGMVTAIDNTKIKIAHRPYYCRVPGCPGKRYKNVAGLKYHAKVEHPGLDFEVVKGCLLKF
ncbi:hypothetical protein HK096_009615 [Nowakowskiella sp. JEL0078]|nr:hypothetical protein HK096_009615 [Nowakowskiella sp. JEL0078]